jgi:hypothetical protein
MNKHLSFLQEAAKFISGAVAADFSIGIWMVATGKYSGFFGISFTPAFIWVWLVIDVALFLLLIHYAWHAHLPGKRPRKGFLYAAGVLFGIVAIVHLLRIIFSVPLLVGSLFIPFWPNAVGAIVTGFLSYTSFAFARHSNK